MYGIKYNIPENMFEQVKRGADDVKFSNLVASLHWFKRWMLESCVNGNVNNRFTLFNKGDGTSIEAQCVIGGAGLIVRQLSPVVNVSNVVVLANTQKTN